MKKPAKIWAVVGFVLLLGYIIYSSMTLAQVSCDVCIEFRGRKECRAASGANAEEAQRAATDLACVFLASGMTDSIACGNTRPASLTCRQR
jgi:hypothetical protein